MLTGTNPRWYFDDNRDGTFDREHRLEKTFLADGNIATETLSKGVYGGALTPVEVKTFSYDLAEGQVGAWQTSYDFDADGVFDDVTTTVQTHGGIYVFGPDRNLDGVPDYQKNTTFTYDANGWHIGTYTAYLSHGGQAPGDYRQETWTRDATTGTAQSYSIDDPISYDCVITYNYVYKHGRLQSIRLIDEVRFGDDRPRIWESYHYNKDGSLKLKTQWAQDEDGQRWQRIDTTETKQTADGYQTTTKKYDVEGDLIPEKIVFVKSWKNDGGKETLRLTHHDTNADGVFDSTDMVSRIFGYHGELVSETIDYGNDGIVEQLFLSDPLLA